MTRHEPPEQRRQQIADALLSTIAERGIGTVTVRDVAAEAGVSVGLVQRHFRTKADLLRFGIEVVYERAEARVQEIAIEPPVRTIITRIARTLLPLDDARDHEFRVWLAFLQASLHDAKMAATHRRATHRMVDGLIEAFEGARRTGELPAAVEPADAATSLVALLDGLCLHAVVTADMFDRLRVSAILETHLDQLFTVGEAGR